MNLGWLFFVLILFSFVSTKLPHYSASVYLPISLLISLSFCIDGDIHDFFKNNNAVFLDPDNGILKKKSISKTSIKHVFFEEIREYNRMGKTAIFTQF